MSMCHNHCLFFAIISLTFSPTVITLLCPWHFIQAGSMGNDGTIWVAVRRKRLPSKISSRPQNSSSTTDTQILLRSLQMGPPMAGWQVSWSFSSTTEFTILLRTIIVQVWDVGCLYFHDGLTFQCLELEDWRFLWGLIMEMFQNVQFRRIVVRIVILEKGKSHRMA